MKNTNLNVQVIRSFSLAIFCSFYFISCHCQTEKDISQLKYIAEKTKIHEDSISLRAETLPEFKVDPHDKESQGNQISGVVRTVFQDKKGCYWFGSQNGLCRKDQSGLVYFDLKDADGKSVTVHVILEDNFGNIWIGYGGGIAKYDGTYFTVFHQKDILTSSGLWSMTIDKKGTLWIGTTNGVFTFDGETFNSFYIPEGKVNPEMGISTSIMIHSIIEDSKGNIWFATNGGAYVFDGKKLKNITEKDTTVSNFINQIIEGRNGSLWISTSNGLFQYDENAIRNITETILGKNVGVGCILEDKTGLLWFTANKREIYNYNGTTFNKLQIQEGDYRPFPFQIYQDNRDRIWFVGFKGAYRLDNNNFVNINRNGPW